MAYLVTGAAGFIGFHLCKRLILAGEKVYGFDNLNDYYELKLKEDRLRQLQFLANSGSKWKFIKGDLNDKEILLNLFENSEISVVVNLAAQAGVRHSIKHPEIYLKSNILGFGNILELCRKFKVKHLIYASSSSVYGGNTLIPFSETHSVNHPISLYAATKRSNEMMAHSYSHLFNIPITGLRFFTVYGPWGRPDMAPMIFTRSILKKEPLKIFNNGDMARDFTYIDDAIEMVFRLLKKPAVANKKFNSEEPDPATSWCPHMIFNIANGKKIFLMDFINLIEKELNIESIKDFQKMQQGDVRFTNADNSSIKRWIDYEPQTEISEGIKKFIKWYRDYYKV
jgi:UDP-glucuronate 4-epimerase